MTSVQPMPTSGALGQLAPSAMLIFAVLALGLALTARLCLQLRLPTATQLSIGILAGLGCLALAMLVLGHLGLIGPWVPPILAALGTIAGLLRRSELTGLASAVRAGLVRHWRRSPVPIAAVGCALALAGLAALAPPYRTDEIEYHWPAALQWAEEGRWVDSDFRHVDGFPMMEIIYTAAATWESYGAAHYLHLLSLVALGLAAAGIASSLGLKGSAAVGTATMAMPVVWDQAYVAYNDTAVGAFATGAVAVVVGRAADRPRSLALAAAMLVGAISSKPTAAAAVGLLGLVLLMQRVAPPRPEQRLSTRQVLVGWLVLGLPTALTLAFWSLRQRAITGALVDPGLTAPPSADALSRLPDTTDRLIAPLMPFVTGIVGSMEPWGGRTSVVLQVFLLPALVYVLYRRGAPLRRFGLLAIPAWAHWVVLGLVGVRTRFHIVVWALLTVSVRSAVEDAGRGRPRLRLALELVWAGCVILGVLDVSLEMGRLVYRDVLPTP